MLEFIPYDLIFGIETEEKSPVEEQYGIERFGSNHLVSAMGAMLVVGLALVALTFALVALWLLAKRYVCF